MTYRDVIRSCKKFAKSIKRIFGSKTRRSRIIIIIMGIIIVAIADIQITGIFRQPQKDVYTPAVISNASGASGSAAEISSMEITTSSAAVESSSDKAIQIEDKDVSTVQQGTNSDHKSPMKNITSARMRTAPDKNKQITSAPEATGNTGELTVVSTTAPISTAIEITAAEEQSIQALSDWLEKRIEQHMGEIEPDDLRDFETITAKLDQGYIQSLASEGIPDKKRAALREYLQAELSEAEYARAKELFAKYSYLMDAD